MSDIYSEKNNRDKRFKKDEDLDSIQNDQKDVGAAESDPSTTGPTENLRAEAAETVDETESDRDSV
jgi:hypothetical protein